MVELRALEIASVTRTHTHAQYTHTQTQPDGQTHTRAHRHAHARAQRTVELSSAGNSAVSPRSSSLRSEGHTCASSSLSEVLTRARIPLSTIELHRPVAISDSSAQQHGHGEYSEYPFLVGTLPHCVPTSCVLDRTHCGSSTEHTHSGVAPRSSGWTSSLCCRAAAARPRACRSTQTPPLKHTASTHTHTTGHVLVRVRAHERS